MLALKSGQMRFQAHGELISNILGDAQVAFKDRDFVCWIALIIAHPRMKVS